MNDKFYFGTFVKKCGIIGRVKEYEKDGKKSNLITVVDGGWLEKGYPGNWDTVFLPAELDYKPVKGQRVVVIGRENTNISKDKTRTNLVINMVFIQFYKPGKGSELVEYELW
jgi:hypothetical protein